jgi:hypothetical protein
METIQVSELMPIVAQIVGRSAIDSLTWEVFPFNLQGGQTAGVTGLSRLVGTAQVGGETFPWSVVVKRISKPDPAHDPTGTADTPSAWNYWKREILAYQSGLLADLTGNLVAPRCYGVAEHPHGEWRIWLEDITENPQCWTLERHGDAARHLGQFNGAYLTGRPLPPEQPWTYRGRNGDWIGLASGLMEPFRRYADSAQGRRWLSDRSVARIEGLLANAQPLLVQLGRLPLCLCHHDAHRRNLLARDQNGTELQTIALDWSMLGHGEVGAEIGITTAVNLAWMDVAGDQARQLDGVVFDSYLAGLRDVGWRGDPRLARFGYTATAALTGCVARTIIFGALILSNEDDTRGLESIVGHSLDEILDQEATIQPFLLDLGDEALQLMESLQ